MAALLSTKIDFYRIKTSEFGDWTELTVVNVLVFSTRNLVQTWQSREDEQLHAGIHGGVDHSLSLV
jgi:hypothetical protein